MTKILSVFWHSVDGHSAGPDGTNPTVSLFREHIRFFRQNYTPISAPEFLRIYRDRRLSRFYDKPPVLLGFDDGFKNIIRHALPVLEELKVPALFFVIGEILRNPDFVPRYIEVKQLLRRARGKQFVYDGTKIDLSLPQDGIKLRRLFGASLRACNLESDRQKLLNNLAALLGVDRPKGSDLDEDLKFVDIKDLVGLTSSSQLTLASHAMTHRYLATLTDEEQVYELEQSDLLLREHCQSYYPVIAYPGGSFNAATIAIAKRTYEGGFSTFLGTYQNLYAYRRICLGHNSVQELAYAISRKRLNYILPIKRLLHITGIRPLGGPTSALSAPFDKLRAGSQR
jgi:peptidoglycan/xylan/chitin deacetylase (PgdA/CDA1 family)